MDNRTDLGAVLVISGTFECRDANGALVKTIEVTGTLPVSDIKPVPEGDDDADQRSE